jgi:hypothetical protein
MVARPGWTPPTLGELSVIGAVTETLLVLGAVALLVWSLVGDFHGEPLQGQLRAFAGYLAAAAVLFPLALKVVGRAAK